MKIFAIIGLTFLSMKGNAQQPVFESYRDDKSKILKGIINRQLIVGDTAFGWWATNAKYAIPSESSVAAFKQLPAGIHFMVFGGTWCEDTQIILPRFYNLLDAAGVHDSLVTLVGVDRKKQTLFGLDKAFNINKAPTIVVMKDGKEIGRIVEFGKYGLIDKELDEIVRGLSNAAAVVPPVAAPKTPAATPKAKTSKKGK
jgi:thiol-disulfide isomerase/thioredoxin